MTELGAEIEAPNYPEIGHDYLPDNVVVHFHFGPHAAAEHVDTVKELLPKADIVVPELHGWNEANISDYRAISRGDQKALDRLTQDNPYDHLAAYRHEMYRALFDKWKPVIFIDASEDEAKALGKNPTHTLLGTVVTTNLDETLQNYSRLITGFAKQSEARNQMMIGNLGTKVTDIVTGHPKLKSKPQVNVLATLGSLHLPMYEYLKQQPETSENVTASMSPIRAPHDEAFLAYSRGHEPSRDQLVEFLMIDAFARVPSLVDSGLSMMSPSNDAVSPRTETLVVYTAIDLMKHDEAAVNLALDIAAHGFTQERRECLMPYISAANKKLYETTGQFIDPNQES
ncbi:MAG: hypothetical protein AAB462_04220 [Patescibacteria group bacterium]